MNKKILEKILSDKRFRDVSLLAAYVFSVGVAADPWN